MMADVRKMFLQVKVALKEEAQFKEVQSEENKSKEVQIEELSSQSVADGSNFTS